MLVFLVGLFALSGLFAADAKIVATEGGVSSSWSSVSWVDSTGNPVQAPINTGDDAILNAMDGAITLTLENDLTITDLFVYGEKGVTINLNGRKLTVNGSIFIGSGPGHTLITSEEANCLGNLTFTNGSVVSNVMNTTSYGDPAKTPNLTAEQRKNVLTIGEGVTSFSVNNCWYVGDYTEAQITNLGNAQLNITRNIDGAPNFVKVLSDQLTTLGIPENVFYWTGSTNDNSWSNSGHWKDKEGNAVSRYPSEMGDVAVFENTSDITITNFSANDNTTIYFRAPNSTGTITFANMQNTSSKKIFVESGKYVLTSAVNSLNVAENAEVSFTSGWLELNGYLRNEGTVNVQTNQVQVNNSVINKGVIDIGAGSIFKVNNAYSNDGTIKSSGGTFSVGDTVTGEVVISKLDATNIRLEGNNNARIKVLSLNNNSVGDVIVKNTELPKGEYGAITAENADVIIAGDAIVKNNLSAVWNKVTLKSNVSLTVNGSLSGAIQLEDGSKCAFNGVIEGQNLSFTPYKKCTIEYTGTASGEINSIGLPNNLEDDVEITIKAENSAVTLNQGLNNNRCNLILEGNVNIGSSGSNQISKFKTLICNENSNVLLNAPITVYENFTNYGTVTQTGTLEINGSFASGTDTSSTYSTVNLVPEGNQITVSGFGAINSLNAQNLGGKTINFKDNITITGQNSNLKGSSNENKLNIGRTTGAITVTNENAISTEYLNFLSSSSPIAIVKEKYINAKNSSAPNGIFPAGWIDDKTYIWRGEVSSILTTQENWQDRRIPGDGDDDVSIIVTKPTENSFPFILETSENRQSMVNFIIEENAEAQIPAPNESKFAVLNVTGGCTNSGTLTNSGELTFKEILSSSGTITNNNLITIENDFVSTGTITNNGKLFIKGTAKISGTYLGTNDSLYIINQDEKRKTVTINSPITIGTLFIAGNVDLELNGAVSVTNFLTNAGDTNFIAHDFTVNIDGSGSLSATSMDFTRASSTDGVIGTYELNVPVTCSGEIKTHSGSVLNIKSNTQTNTLVHSANNANYQTFINVKSNASLTVNETIDLAANANSGASLSVESGATVKAKSIIDTSTFANGEGQIPLTNNGIIEVSESIDLTTISNFGTITTPTINTSSITNSGAISATTKFTATEYLRPTDSTSDVVNIKEGTTLLIENGTISTLNVEKTDDDFATISSTGTLTISSATYNNADIQTNGKITLANTIDSDSIGNLTIETGELTIENLNVENLTNKANFSSSTVNITGDLTDSGTSFVGTINFVGNGEQTFTPNTSTTYGDINIGDGTSASSTSFAGSLSSGIISIRENSTLKTNGISITAETFNIAQTNAVLELSNATISTLKDSTYRGIRGSGFTISAAEEKIITIDQDTVETTGNQNYFASVKLTNETTFKSGGTIIFGNVTTDAFVQNDDVAPKLILQAPTVIYGNSTIDSITTSETLSLESDNTINNLSVTTAGGKTLTINGKITVDSLSLSGTSSESLLQIDGSGSFNLTTPPAQYVGNYLKFAQPNTPTVSVNGDNNQKAKIRNSKDSADGITSFPSGWEYDNTFTWTGATSNDWNVATNWDQGEVPNVDSVVVIPADKKVIISGNFTHSGTITNNGELTFGENAGPGQTVTDVYTFTNNGTITNSGKLKVNGNLTNNSSATIANIGKLEVGIEAAVPPCKFTNNGSLQNAQNTSNDNGIIKIKGTFDNTNGTVTNLGKITLNSDFDLNKGTYTEVGILSFEGKKDPNTGDVSTIVFTSKEDNTLKQIEAKNVYLKINGNAIIPNFINDNAILEIPTGSNVSIQNYSPFIPTDGPDAGQPREKNDLIIYEGATVDIKNDVTITNLTVQTSTDNSDFAHIITKNLSVTNATYNTADIKTKGNITLPETTETTNEIHNLEIDSGNLTIPNLIANKVSNGGKLSASGSVTITTDLSNTGTVETATLSVGQDISNNAVITTTTTNVGRNLTDSGTSFEGTINFVGTSDQTFSPNANTIYDDINIGDGTSASTTTLTNDLKAGIVTIANNSTLQTNGSEITNIEITKFDIEEGSQLILNGAMVTTSDATTYRGLSGTYFFISAGTNSITIDQETVQTTAEQVYESPVTLTRDTTFEITGDGNALVFEKPITTNGNSLTAKTNEGDITFGSENSEAFSDKATVDLQGPATIYGENEFASIASNDSLTLINNNTVETLRVTNAGGKTLTIDGQITVTTMELSGTNTDNLLQIDGSGKFSFTAELNANVKVGTYLKFKNKESPMVVIPNKPNGMDILENSFDHNGETTEFPSGWQEIIGINTRTWEGDVDTDWDNPENWEEGSNPNQESNVYIPVVQEGSSYPITNEEINVKSLNIATDAKITLNNLLTATDGITNEGTITLTNDYTVTCTILNKGQIDATKSLIIQNGAQVINNKKIIIYENLVVKNDAELINQKLDNSYTGITVYDNVTIAGNYSGDGLFNLSDKANPHTITIDTQTTISSLGIVGTQIDFVCNSPLTVGTLTKAEGLIYLQNGELSIGNYSQDSSISDTENILKLNEDSSISFTNPVEFHTVEIINKDDSSVANINATDFTTETLNVYGDFTNANSNAINVTTMTVDMNQPNADSDVVIGGNFSVVKFNCKEQGGKNLTLNGMISGLEEMSISGTKNAEIDETNYLTLQGIGSFAYNDSDKTQFVGSYLKFTSDAPIVSKGHAEITSSEHDGTAFPTGWILPSETTWEGGLISGQRWSYTGNWTKGVPTISTKVEIPKLQGWLPYYPEFGDQAGTLIEMLSLKIAEGAKITAASDSSVETFKVHENFTNEGNISNTEDGSSPFAIWVGGNLTNNSTGTINTNSSIEVHGEFENKGAISGNNYSISAYGNVSLLGGSITGYSAFNLINTNSRFSNTFNVDSSYTLPSLTIQEGGFDFNITDTLRIENTLTNNGMLNVRKGTLIVPTYEGTGAICVYDGTNTKITDFNGSGDIYLFKGSNLTIENCAGTGTIYLEEGATLTIENATENPKLVIQTTTDETDFATISTNGNLTISSTVYKINDESVDIKTSGNGTIKLPSTESTTNEIGNLLIGSGNLTIETLYAANITNNGNLNAATSVQATNITNSGEITTPTVKATAELSNAENATITATNGSVTVGTNLTNSGEISSDTVFATGDLSNDGILNATTSVEAKNIVNSGEITTPTVKANAELSNAENATITATNGSVTVGANLTNAGEISGDIVLATGDLTNNGKLNATTSVEATNITNSGSMNVATTNVGGNLIDNGTWQQTDSTEINFNGTDAQEFTPNPNSTYALINVENSGGILTINKVLNVTNLQINSNVIFEDTATIENLSIDMSSSEDENFVKFAGEKTYTITTLVRAKGNQNSKLKLASTNDKLWNVYFENKPEIESFEYVEVSKSQSVDENGSVKELNYIEAEENLLSDEECTTIGWFNFNSYYWTGNQSTEWAEVKNWARRPNGNGKFAEAPSKNSSTLKVYILQTAVNSLIENAELITINSLENPEGKSVELNKGAEIQTIKNAGQIATQESVTVTTFENKGSIFVNAGILTIENYVPTSDKINIKDAATLKITKAEETTISDLTFEKTDSLMENFAILEGNLSVENATYNSADIQTKGTIKLPSTESTTNEIGNLLIGSGNLTIETLHGANLTNDGTLSTKTITVTQNITNNHEITSDTVLATGDLTNDGTLNATTSVEANNIVNTGEITTPTVKANAELTNAENATITATNGSVTVGTNLTNAGTLSTKTITVTQNITNSGSMNVATTNVGGNLIDNGTWAESGIINFVGTNDQNFDSNPVTTYALINVEKLSGILTLGNDLNAKDFVLKGGDLFINKILTTQRDVILLGKKYSVKDSVTNVDLFDYKGEVEFEILDATLLGTKVQLADDASIFVGKNFYANGIDISGGKIFIQKPINFAPFAQSFNGEISNNKAICSCVDCETEPNQTHAKIMAVGCVDKGENSGWDFDDATILKAQTVRDDVIKVFVNQPLAKISDENLSEFKFLIDDELNGSFQGIYSDVDCTQVFEDEIGTFDQTENSYYFFLKATSKWNTDASGSFAGKALSTASDNLHYNSIPVIDVPRYTQEKGVIVKNKWGKPFANLSSRFFNGSSFVNVSDNCGPVLVEVKTGQEVHNLYDEAIGQSSQPSYDAHNFIEFEYSEPIIFKGNAYSSLDENIFVTSEFGQTDNSGGTLKINGLASFQKGKLITQSKDSTIADNQVNAFYRKDEYSFRFSVAGLTKGTIEYNSNEYKNWIGYIEEAEIPSGTVTLEFDSEGKNPFIQDLQLNHQEEWTSAPKLVVDSSFVGDFGAWDLSSPNFAFHVSEDKQIDWYEFVGNGDGFIKNIEFHLFDNDLENNTSVYDGAYWQIREGWLNQAGTLKIPESYAADIFGGSRPFITDEQNRTAGGIRLSSVYNTFENFEYSYGQIAPKSFVSFDTNVSAALFQSSSSEKTRNSNSADGLYFALGITEIGLPLKTTFSVSYKSTDTLVVTDLAGNKLKDVAKISSYDVTPPAFTISVTPHNSDEIYMLFSEQINFADFEVKLSDNSSKTYNLVESISNVFEFGRIVDGHWQTIQDLKVESIKERKVFDAHTEIVLKLNQKLNFEQIQQIYIRVAKGLDNTVDVVTGSHNANVTLIQDDKGNYMMQYMAHPISDFAVDVLNLNYAYNSDIVNPSASENLDTTKEQKSRVVHDWSRTQANFGTLLLNHDITFNGTILAESIADTQMIFSSSPEKESVASFYNEWTKKDSRIWLAEIPGFESLKFDSWSKENNSSVQFVPSEKENDSITFDILKEQIPDVTSLSFLFALKDANSEYLTVNHYPAYNYSTKMYDLGQKFPLFALRLDNKEDIKSFDLWSLKLDSISLQRGGVTILNNVINPLLGDKAILKLDLAQKARVNILVMTLDGNIVKYLNRGSLDSGEYQFTWDGTNNSGKPVARGMYFIRVFGNGIDETRKVLVVK